MDVPYHQLPMIGNMGHNYMPQGIPFNHPVNPFPSHPHFLPVNLDSSSFKPLAITDGEKQQQQQLQQIFLLSIKKQHEFIIAH